MSRFALQLMSLVAFGLTWFLGPFEPSSHPTALEWLSSYTGCNDDVDLSQQSSSYDDYTDLCGSVAHGRSLTQSKAHPTR